MEDKLTQLHEDGFAIVKQGPCPVCGKFTVRAYPSYGGLVRVCSLEHLKVHEDRIADEICGEDETLIFLKKQAD